MSLSIVSFRYGCIEAYHEGNVFYFEGNYSEYEANKALRLGLDEPKRARYRKLMEE